MSTSQQKQTTVGVSLNGESLKCSEVLMGTLQIQLGNYSMLNRSKCAPPYALGLTLIGAYVHGEKHTFLHIFSLPIIANKRSLIIADIFQYVTTRL